MFSDSTILIVAAIVIVGWYLAAFLVARLFFGHSRQEAGIARLSAGVSAVGFLRIVVLGSLFGAQAALTVAVAALVVNLALVPVAVTLVAPAGTKPSAALMQAIEQPLVHAQESVGAHAIGRWWSMSAWIRVTKDNCDVKE